MGFASVDCHVVTLGGVEFHSPFGGPLLYLVKVILKLSLVVTGVDGPV